MKLRGVTNTDPYNYNRAKNHERIRTTVVPAEDKNLLHSTTLTPVTVQSPPHLIHYGAGRTGDMVSESIGLAQVVLVDQRLRVIDDEEKETVVGRVARQKNHSPAKRDIARLEEGNSKYYTENKTWHL